MLPVQSRAIRAIVGGGGSAGAWPEPGHGQLAGPHRGRTPRRGRTERGGDAAEIHCAPLRQSEPRTLRPAALAGL